MQTQTVYYEHKINVFVWLIIQDQYSAEHKCILNFVLIIKDLLIFFCMCHNKLWFLNLVFSKLAIDHKYSGKINSLHVLFLLMLVSLKNRQLSNINYLSHIFFKNEHSKNLKQYTHCTFFCMSCLHVIQTWCRTPQ